MRPRRILILAVVAAALLRAAWSANVSPAAFLEIDGHEYRDIAHNLSAGRGYAVSAPRWFEPAALLPAGPRPDFARPPAVPLLGAALFFLPGAWEFWARAVMIALGTLAVWLAYRIGETLFDQRAGAFAAVILALHPYAIFYSGRWSTETPFLVAILAAVLTLARDQAENGSASRRSAGRTALAGLFAGLAALTRPTGLVLAPAFAVWILLRRKQLSPAALSAPAGSPTNFPPTTFLPTARTGARNGARAPRPGRRLRLSRAAVFLAAAGLTLAPWSLRNHAATGRWNPGTFFGPYNLWAGMHGRVLSMYRSADSPRYAAEVRGLFREDTRAMVQDMEARGISGPIAEGRYWLQAAGEWIGAHPGPTAEILLRRAGHFFRVSPEASVVSPAVRVAALYLWPVHAAAVCALWWHRRRVPWLLLVPAAAGFLVSLPFTFSLRLRFPFLDPFAVLLAGAAIRELPDRLRSIGAPNAGG